MHRLAHLPDILPENPLAGQLSDFLQKLQNIDPSDQPNLNAFPLYLGTFEQWVGTLAAMVYPLLTIQTYPISEINALRLTQGSNVLSDYFKRLVYPHPGALEQDFHALLLKFLPTQPACVSLLETLHHHLLNTDAETIDLEQWEPERVAILSLRKHGGHLNTQPWQQFVSTVERHRLRLKTEWAFSDTNVPLQTL